MTQQVRLLIRLQDCYDDHTLVVNEYERKQIYGVYIVIMKIKKLSISKTEILLK
jgi:hypothetical protein